MILFLGQYEYCWRENAPYFYLVVSLDIFRNGRLEQNDFFLNSFHHTVDKAHNPTELCHCFKPSSRLLDWRQFRDVPKNLSWILQSSVSTCSCLWRSRYMSKRAKNIFESSILARTALLSRFPLWFYYWTLPKPTCDCYNSLVTQKAQLHNVILSCPMQLYKLLTSFPLSRSGWGVRANLKDLVLTWWFLERPVMSIYRCYKRIWTSQVDLQEDHSRKNSVKNSEFIWRCG